jgi:hypothetical protein
MSVCAFSAWSLSFVWLLRSVAAPHGELVLPHELVDDAPDAVVAGHIREVAQDEGIAVCG